MKTRVLIVSLDPVGENMAGPAIRNLEFARVLSGETRVTLAVPNGDAPIGYDVRVVGYDAERLSTLASECDALIVSGRALWSYPFLGRLEKPLVVDVYDPFGIESLPLLFNEPEAEQARRHTDVLDALTDLFTFGDFFICASEKQRDFWLGWLEATNRINRATYAKDATFRSLIDVVPFGIPGTPPQHTRAVLKGVHPGIEENDHVILWGGGVYNWFDPLTLIRAMERISTQRDDVKLFFMGVRHPTPGASGGDMADRAAALSRELGLLDLCIFFNEWTAYRDRQNYLLEADLGVSLHVNHLETHLSFRTRLLDYIWAGLPMVVTRGDVLSELVKREQLGWTVDEQDVEQVTSALLAGLEASRSDFSDRFAAVAQTLVWETTTRPLLEFLRAPRLAPDRRGERGALRSLPTLRLVGELGSIRRECSAKDSQLVELNNLLRRAETEVAGRDASLELRQSEIGSLRYAVDELKGRATELETVLSHREEELAELRRLHEVKDTEIGRLHDDLRRAGATAREQRIAHLEAVRHLREAKDEEIAAWRADLGRVRDEAHAQHVASLEAIQQLKEDRHAETEALREELARTRADALSRRAEDLEAVDRLRQAHDDAIRASEAELTDLRARLEAITQGRLMRFLDGGSRILRGRPFI